VVLRDLRQRQDGFDGQTGVAEQRDVAWRRRDEGQQDMDDEEAGGEVGKELVVAAQSTISSALFLAWEKERNGIGVRTVARWAIARSHTAADPAGATVGYSLVLWRSSR
jgi:hypothetical protein